MWNKKEEIAPPVRETPPAPMREAAREVRLRKCSGSLPCAEESPRSARTWW